MTANYYVVGDPIAHSLSPLIHQTWYENYGLEARYSARHIPSGDFDAELQAADLSQAEGINVTLPHKGAALAAAAEASAAARTIGAANTLTRTATGWRADNTDAPGFMTALKDHYPASVEGQKIAILGAGGSARAIVYALHQAGADLRIHNRTLEKAEQLSEHLTGGSATARPIENSSRALTDVDIVINTLSLGHQGQTLDVGPGKDRLFFDISYGAAHQAQKSCAEKAGWRTADGLGMLVAQAAESFRIWFDIVPERSLVLELCRARVETQI